MDSIIAVKHGLFVLLRKDDKRQQKKRLKRKCPEINPAYEVKPHRHMFIPADLCCRYWAGPSVSSWSLHTKYRQNLSGQLEWQFIISHTNGKRKHKNASKYVLHCFCKVIRGRGMRSSYVLLALFLYVWYNCYHKIQEFKFTVYIWVSSVDTEFRLKLTFRSIQWTVKRWLNKIHLLCQRLGRLYSWSAPDYQRSFSEASNCCLCYMNTGGGGGVGVNWRNVWVNMYTYFDHIYLCEWSYVRLVNINWQSLW